MNKIRITWDDIYREVEKISPEYKDLKVYGVPRGGMYIAPLFGRSVDSAALASVIVDDLIDSGATRDKYKKLFPNKVFFALFEKQSPDDWYEFPWDIDPDKEVSENVTRLLQYVGEDVKREGLLETPKRHVKFLKEFCSPKGFEFTSFKNEGIDEMIVQKDIPFYSLCEHHMVPFFGTAAVAYIPGDRIVGLSKLARTVETISSRLQNQERITQSVAETIQSATGARGVAVVLKARHLCMEMRGVKKPGAETITSHMSGVFKTDLNCRQEFLKLI